MSQSSFRTVWLSDIHLGSRDCRVALLLDFLRHTDCETLYLVGDIIDIKRMRRTFYWPTSHTEVLRVLLKKSQQGTRIVYIPGNHDDDLRALAGTKFGNIDVALRDVHVTATGRRLLVLHGDEFDAVIKCGALSLVLGSLAYATLLVLNRLVHWYHELTGRSYWSLAQHVKSKLGKAQRYIATFERASMRAAVEAGVDGVVCGHIHKADLLERDGITYCNDGDWVESCTALVERDSGELELIAWRPALSTSTVPLPVQEAA